MDGGEGHTAWAPEGREGRSQAGPKGPKGRKLEVGTQRAPRLLVWKYFLPSIQTWTWVAPLRMEVHMQQ